MKQKAERLENDLNEKRLMFNDKEREYIATISNLRSSVSTLEAQHQQEIAVLKDNFKGDILKVELHLKKQRERTLYLLADKDSEINRLKGIHDCDSSFEKRVFTFPHNNDASLVASPLSPATDNTVKRSVETEVAVSELLSRQNSVSI